MNDTGPPNQRELENDRMVWNGYRGWKPSRGNLKISVRTPPLRRVGYRKERELRTGESKKPFEALMKHLINIQAQS